MWVYLQLYVFVLCCKQSHYVFNAHIRFICLAIYRYIIEQANFMFNTIAVFFGGFYDIKSMKDYFA